MYIYVYPNYIRIIRSQACKAKNIMLSSKNKCIRMFYVCSSYIRIIISFAIYAACKADVFSMHVAGHQAENICMYVCMYVCASCPAQRTHVYVCSMNVPVILELFKVRK
jgi:hypothetical protein